MGGLKKGDKVKVVDNSDNFHNFKVGEIVEYHGEKGIGFHECKRTGIETLGQTLKPHHFEKIEEESMTSKKSVSAKSERNPKNFRNGDVVKVSDKKGTADAMVFVKFGENYYNLTAGGQMKACRYLPRGTKEIITNLSGMGKFFLMSEEELEERAGSPFGGGVTDTNEDYYWTTPKGLTGVTTTQFITDEMIKDFETLLKTDTTEEK